MLRVLVDPNVFVSAAVAPLGVVAGLVRAGLAGRFRFVVCPQLLDELAAVLRRPRFRAYLDLDDAEEFLAGISGAAEHSGDPNAARTAVRDSGDDYLVALAEESACDRVVSGDRDLLEQENQRVPVVSPRELLDELEARGRRPGSTP